MKERILYIGPIPPEVGGRTAGGIATHCWELAVQARKIGYRSHIFTGTEHSSHKTGVEIIAPPRRNKFLKGFSLIKYFRSSNRRNLSFLRGWSAREKVEFLYLTNLLREIIAEIRPDLIHIHSLLSRAGLSMEIIKPAVPLVITNYELYLGGQPEREIPLMKRILSRTSYLLHISRYTRERSRGLGLDFNGKEKVVYMPVNADRVPLMEKEKIRQKLGWGRKKVVFFAGDSKLIEKKGLDILLEAFAVNKDLARSCRLIVRTRGSAARIAEEAINRNGLDGAVIPILSWEEMIKYYNASDIFVMPSRSEGLGLVYLEALLAGTPVVGFDRTLAEMEERLGICLGEKFNAQNEKANGLARKILKVLNHDFNRELLRESVIQNLSWEREIGEFDTIYQEVLAHG